MLESRTVTKKTAGFLGFYPLSAAKRSIKYGVGWGGSWGKPSSLLGFLGYWSRNAITEDSDRARYTHLRLKLEGILKENIGPRAMSMGYVQFFLRAAHTHRTQNQSNNTTAPRDGLQILMQVDDTGVENPKKSREVYRLWKTLGFVS